MVSAFRRRFFSTGRKHVTLSFGFREVRIFACDTHLSLCVQCKHIIYSFLEARLSRFTLESRIGHPHSVVYDCTMGPQSILQ